MAGNVSRENGRKGGRPQGSKTQATVEKEATLAAFKEKVRNSADVLYRSQMTLAIGQTYLYKVIPPDKKPILVTDTEEIEAFLREEVTEGTYYFLTTKDPDNKAIDSLLDRTYGKAQQNIDHTIDAPSFTPDDIRMLLGTLNPEEQEEFYNVLDKYVTLAERRRSIGAVQEAPARKPRANKSKVQRKTNNVPKAL